MDRETGLKNRAVAVLKKNFALCVAENSADAPRLTTCMQPPCWIISLEHRPKSRQLLSALAGSLDRWGWQYSVWPAVRGDLVTGRDWQHIGVDLHTSGKLSRRPGAQGCWLSHWQLWQQVDDRGMIILEDDAVAEGAWQPDFADPGQMVKLTAETGTKTNPDTGRWSPGSHAYWIPRDLAQQLMLFSRVQGARAVDKQLGDRVLPWRFLGRNLFTLNPRRGPSTTSPLIRA